MRRRLEECTRCSAAALLAGGTTRRFRGTARLVSSRGFSRDCGMRVEQALDLAAQLLERGPVVPADHRYCPSTAAPPRGDASPARGVPDADGVALGNSPSDDHTLFQIQPPAAREPRRAAPAVFRRAPPQGAWRTRRPGCPSQTPLSAAAGLDLQPARDRGRVEPGAPGQLAHPEVGGGEPLHDAHPLAPDSWRR